MKVKIIIATVVALALSATAAASAQAQTTCDQPVCVSGVEERLAPVFGTVGAVVHTAKRVVLDHNVYCMTQVGDPPICVETWVGDQVRETVDAVRQWRTEYCASEPPTDDPSRAVYNALC